MEFVIEQPQIWDAVSTSVINDSSQAAFKRSRHKRILKGYCNICKRTIANIYQHKVIHEEDRPRRFKCETCGKSYLTKQGLSVHSEIHLPEKSFSCYACHMQFQTSYELRKHIGKLHNQNNKFLCATCGKEFSTKSKLTQHMNTHASERPFKCEFCGKGFNYDNVLKDHIRIHSGDRPFKCTRCEKCFRQKSNLKSHIRFVHEGEKTKQCQKCDYKFATTSDLKRHMRRVHKDPNSVINEVLEKIKGIRQRGPRNFQCEICSRRYINIGGLKRHMKSHQSKGFRCSICSQNFTTENALDDHVQRFEDKLPIRCDYCGNFFHTVGMAKRHLSNHIKDGLLGIFDNPGPVQVEIISQENTPGFVTDSCTVFGKWEVCILVEDSDSESLEIYQQDPKWDVSRSIDTVFLDLDETYLKDINGDLNDACNLQETSASANVCDVKNMENERSDIRIESKGRNDLIIYQKQTDKIKEPASIRCHVAHASNSCQSNEEQCLTIERKATDYSRKIDVPSERTVCDICGKLVKGITEHMLLHSDKFYYKCEFCKKSFRTQYRYKVHKRLHGKTMPFPCQRCSKGFENRNALVQHTLIHTGKKPFSCSVCTKTFRIKAQLNRHVNKHAIYRHSCSICNRPFPDILKLKRHEELHIRPRPYTCNICGKGFRSTACLWAHKYTHSYSKPYQCQFCEASFMCNGTFRRHLAYKHNGAETLHCRQCNSDFIGSLAFIKHKKYHCSNRYSCKICSRKFCSAENLDSHLLKFKNVFVCYECEKKFHYKYSLLRHLLLHSGSTSNDQLHNEKPM